jgi:hypothetical protein
MIRSMPANEKSRSGWGKVWSCPPHRHRHWDPDTNRMYCLDCGAELETKEEMKTVHKRPKRYSK